MSTKWEKFLESEYEEPSEYEEFLGSLLPGLVYMEIDNTEEQIMFHPDADGFVDHNDDPVELKSKMSEYAMSMKYEPVPYEMLEPKWHEILGDYEVIYPFSLSEIWSRAESQSQPYRKTLRAYKFITLSYAVEMVMTDLFYTPAAGAPPKLRNRYYQVRWKDFVIAPNLTLEMKKNILRGMSKIHGHKYDIALSMMNEDFNFALDYKTPEEFNKHANLLIDSPLAKKYLKVFGEVMNFHWPEEE